MSQTRHAVLRNYPVAAHLRFLLESIRPEMRQYFFEGDKDGAPFPRDKRAIVYQRAKKELDKRPFGTQLDVKADGHEWLNHAMVPSVIDSHDFRLTIGGPTCTQPYDASIFNISAMSFGALSANAIQSLNAGAKKGRFAHDTGEGSISAWHRVHGGDLIWQIASPKWQFDDATFERSATAFDNPDHVAIVIHNYRWRLELADGESKYDELEKQLAGFPVISVPTITLQGDADGAPHPDPTVYVKKFSGKYSHRSIEGGIGHNLPQEAPAAFAQAIIDVDRF